MSNAAASQGVSGTFTCQHMGVGLVPTPMLARQSEPCICHGPTRKSRYTLTALPAHSPRPTIKKLIRARRWFGNGRGLNR